MLGEKEGTKGDIRRFKEKDDDRSKIEYWKSRKAYERAVENKRYIWQEKVAEYVNKLDRK
jgi:hypothetical protein